MTRRITVAAVERLWFREVSLIYIARAAGRAPAEIVAWAREKGWPERSRSGVILDAARLARFDALWTGGGDHDAIAAATGLTVAEQRRLARRRKLRRPGVNTGEDDAPRRRGARLAVVPDAGLRRPAYQPRMRACLGAGCSRTFFSTAIGHRLCPNCNAFAQHANAGALA